MVMKAGHVKLLAMMRKNHFQEKKEHLVNAKMVASVQNQLVVLEIKKNVPTHQKENHLLNAMILVQNQDPEEALVIAKASHL